MLTTRDVYRRLVDLAVAFLRMEEPDAVISGMALGWDTALAEAALRLNIPLWAYVPFRRQERRWPESAQQKYRDIIKCAEKVNFVCDGGYASWKMQTRNEEMVDDCTLLVALWNGSDGGTGNCMRYADSVGRQYVNLWSTWEKYKCVGGVG